MAPVSQIEDISRFTFSVDLSEKNIDDVGAKALSRALKSCKFLKELRLGGNNIGEEGAKALSGALKSCKKLTSLCLAGNNIGGEGVRALFGTLKDCEDLKNLGLEGNSIGDEGARALSGALKDCKGLTELDLRDNNIGEEGARALSGALESCKNLTFLYLSENNIGEEGAKALAGALKDYQRLQALVLEGNNIGAEGAKALSGALKDYQRLQALVLEGNNIGEEGAKALSEALESCKKLTVLRLSENSIGDVGAKALSGALKDYESLEVLALEGNNIGEEGAKALSGALESCKNLMILYLEGNNIGVAGAKALSEALKDCEKLTDLYLKGNNIGDEGVKFLSEALERCKNLTRLHLGDNNIGEEGVEALSEALKSCKKLDRLYLSDNNIGEEGAKALSGALKDCEGLTELYIKGNNIGDKGVKLLSGTLESCENLTELDLEGNNIGVAGAKALSEALKDCEKLTDLYLEGNNIGEEGAKALSEALESCKKLTVLRLSENSIGDVGAKALSGALKDCEGLTEFYLEGNNIGDEGAKSLSEALKSCNNLTDLCLEGNNIGEEGAKALSEALESCKKLTVLRLERNNIGDEGAKSLSEALKSCNNLTDLCLSENSIGDVGAKALSGALESCKNLTSLRLESNNISIKGAMTLFVALGGHKRLKELNLLHNAIRIEGSKALADILHEVCPAFQISSEFDKLPIHKNLIATLSLGSDPSEISTYGVNASSDQLDNPNASFSDVIEFARKISNLRTSVGGVRGESMRASIDVLKEYVTAPISSAIQRYIEQLRLRQFFGDIANAKACLETLQEKIRKSPPSELLPSLIKERDAEKVRLQSLMQTVSPWLREKSCEKDEDLMRGLKAKLQNVSENLDTSDASLRQETFENDLQQIEELEDRVKAWLEERKTRSESASAFKQQSMQALEKLTSRASELGLGDVFTLAVGTPEKATDIEGELLSLRGALQEELNFLQDDTLEVQMKELLSTVSCILRNFENLAEKIGFDETAFHSPKALIDFVLLGSREPNLLHLEQLHKKLELSRGAIEILNSLKKVKDLAEKDAKANTEHFKTLIAQQEMILSDGTPIELSKKNRHKLAETLQHAQEHFPELLKDNDWLERLHVSAEDTFEVARSGLWLANVKVSDYQFVGEPLASRGGKMVQKILDTHGRTFVLKQFQLGDMSQSKAFYRQVANLGKVASPHVIQIIGAFVDAPAPGMPPRGCIVMPYYEHGDLAKWIVEHTNEDKAVRDRLATGLLIGIAEFHAHGIVHCDIKPENIFLTSNGTPLLGDFDGIKLADCTATYTSLQATPHYIAPELRNGPVDVLKTAMDMYSVGVVLEDLYPDPTPEMLELINLLKVTDPDQRLSACEALQHKAFGATEIAVETCLVCMEEIKISEGTSCEKGDFLCKNCLESSVAAAAEPQASVRIDADGAMACIKPECSGRILGRDITRLAPDAVNHLLRIAQTKVESEAAIRAEREIQNRMAQILQTEGLAQCHLQHIQEEILNICCPHCRTCFDQFDDCCAVECGNAACGHYFCAWCLQYKSRDNSACHSHVRTCSRKLGDDPFFPNSFEQVREAWQLIRAERLREYWRANIKDRSLPEILEAQLVPMLTQDLVGSEFSLQ